jgi:N utilization substance protein B homolog
MKRVSRVILYLLLYAKTEGNDKETFIMDLLEKETFETLVDPGQTLTVEHLPQEIDTIEAYKQFRDNISSYLNYEDRLALADLYDTFEMIKAQKLVKDYEKAPEEFSESLARKVELYLAYAKEKLVAQEEKIKVKYDLSLEEVLALDELAEVILSHKEAIDEKIEAQSENWKIKRMLKADVALLRMGIYELSYQGVELISLIDDYIEIAKSYNGEESYKFINAILDHYYKEVLQ